MEKIVSLCKRRGFIFQSSEIYGGLNGFWDYGPLGAELKRNIKECWWRSMTQLRDDVVGLDASIIMHPKIWEASGHTSTFSDLMVDCLLTKKRFRADQVEPQSGTAYFYTGASDGSRRQGIQGRVLGADCDGQARGVCAQGGEAILSAAGHRESGAAGRTHRGGQRQHPLQPGERQPADRAAPVQPDAQDLRRAGRKRGQQSYLRPETAQAIFVQFKNALDVSRQRVPFGVCQIGKAFRNEINPRNFTFRSREFEQMELEFFIRPDEVVQKMTGSVASLSDPQPSTLNPQPNWGWELWHKYWVEQRIQWYESIGLGRDTLVEYWQKKEELAHYARATVDILFKFPFGTQELEGIAARGDFDLTQHQKFSGKSMEYFDEEAKAKYVPHVIEPSAGRGPAGAGPDLQRLLRRPGAG